MDAGKEQNNMEFISAKTILTKVKYGSFWYGINYNMNLYKGCSHGCIYCDSRSECYHIDAFDTVRSKQDALLLLEKELIQKREKGIIGIGSMSDTYNPMERKYEITRGALKLIEKYHYGVSIDTKSDLIVRDLDLLKQIAEKNDVIIKFTITTPHDALSSIIEPYVCSSSRRFKAIKTLSENGIFVGIMMNPVLPFITDKEVDIRLFIKKASENGAKFIHTYMGMTLRQNQRDYYYHMLDKHFKGYRNLYQKKYGNRYDCTIPSAEKKYKIFTEECEKYGILYRMDDIIKAYKRKPKTHLQLCLFDEK